MLKKVNNHLIFEIVTHHLNHYLLVKKMLNIDYESHSILLTAYIHFLYNTNKNALLDWDQVFESTKDKSNFIQKKKLTIFAIAQILQSPKETIRRKLNMLIKRNLLGFSTSNGVTLGSKFAEKIKPLGAKDMQSLSKMIRSIKDYDALDALIDITKK